jgi:hypothetical protein
MKTTIKVVIAALTLSAFALDGCKKGPNDPFMSIHSRKARMTGDWNTTAGSGSYGSSAGTTTWTYDGTTYSETDASGTSTNGMTMTMNFEKDGTYKSVTTNTATGYSDVVTETGTWNFTGKVGDDKNKDHVVMKTLVSTDVTTIGSSSSTSTDTYTGDDAPVALWYLDELKNKEIIFTWDGTYVNGSSNSFSKGTYTMAQ